MSNKTKIEWVRTYQPDGTFTEGYTVNPIRFRPHGSDRLTTMCQKISPGCTHCYAEGIIQRFWPLDANSPFPGYTAKGVASGKFELDEKLLLSVLKIKNPAKIFWGDMTDLFQEGIGDDLLDKCLAVCALTPHLTHMFLTKRPERMLKYFTEIRPDMHSARGEVALVYGRPARFFPQEFKRLPLNQDATNMKWPLPNVMLGVSAENQKYFDERMPYFAAISGWRKFLSLEPLLGPINTHTIITPHGWQATSNALAGISLVITGGESGRKARPMISNWAGDIADQVQTSGVSFFHKQNGEWVDAGHEEFGRLPEGKIKYLRSDGSEWAEGTVPWHDENADVNTVKFVGKKRAGNTLFGKVYHQFPRG